MACESTVCRSQRPANLRVPGAKTIPDICGMNAFWSDQKCTQAYSRMHSSRESTPPSPPRPQRWNRFWARKYPIASALSGARHCLREHASGRHATGAFSSAPRQPRRCREEMISDNLFCCLTSDSVSSPTPSKGIAPILPTRPRHRHPLKPAVLPCFLCRFLWDIL